MINLKNSGINLKYDEVKKSMYFKDKKLKPDVRKLQDMKSVLLFKTKQNKNLYYMYRDITSTDEMKESSIRYDITVIFSGKIGNEFVKTAGHYHPEERKNISYPEVYEILYGQAYILIEEINKNNEVKKNYLIIAEKGEKVLIPPNFGHITINTTDKLLIMANVVERNFKSNYKPVKQKHGASYYIIDDNGPVIIRNKSYKNAPLLKEIRAKSIVKLGLTKKNSLYSSVAKNPGKYEYLVKPHKYKSLFREFFKQ